MMDSPPVVFDISSDEEGWGDNKGVAEESRDGGDFDNLDWLSELFEIEVKDSDDSDDVVVVGEVLQKNTKRKRDMDGDGDDDDCVMLDEDPDKAGAIEKKDDTTAADSDDLVIVGEKGQIACRDYPHSRHLCATYPFASTSHETHCQQCHCYVCDSLAPCAHWGNGASNIHHCHATDKDEFWKLQRKNFRQGYKVPAPRLPDPSLSIRPNHSLRVPTGNSHLPYIPAPAQYSRSTTIRACSTASNIGVMNTISQDRSQQPGQVMSRNKYQPHLVAQQLHSLSSRRDRPNPHARLGPRFNSATPFKRTGSAMVNLATYRPGFGSSANSTEADSLRSPSSVSSGVSSSLAYQNPYRQVSTFRNSVPSNLPGVASPAASTPRMPAFKNSGTGFVRAAPPSLPAVAPPSMSTFGSSLPAQSHVSASQPNMGNNLGNPVSSRSHVSSSQRNMGNNLGNPASSQSHVSSSQPNIGNNLGNLVSCQAHVSSSQPNMGSNLGNPVSSQRQVSSSQPSMRIKLYSSNQGNSFVPSQVSSSHQPVVGSNFISSKSSQPQVGPYQNVESSFVDQVPSVHQLYDQTIQAENYDVQNPSFAGTDGGWEPFVDQIQEQQQTFADDPSALQSYHPPFVSGYEPQDPPPEANPNTLEFQYDSWIVENDGGGGGGGGDSGGAFDVASASGLNMYSPELDPISLGGGGNFLF